MGRTYGEYIAAKNAGRLFPIYEADKHDLAFEYTFTQEFDDALDGYRADMNRMLFSKEPVFDFQRFQVDGGQFTIPIKKSTGERYGPITYEPDYQRIRFHKQLTLFDLPWWATGAPVPRHEEWEDE